MSMCFMGVVCMQQAYIDRRFSNSFQTVIAKGFCYYYLHTQTSISFECLYMKIIIYLFLLSPSQLQATPPPSLLFYITIHDHQALKICNKLL